MCRCADTQTCKLRFGDEGMMCGYANVWMCRCADMQMCRCADMQMCKYADVQMI
jgi:hypothetical protein